MRSLLLHLHTFTITFCFSVLSSFSFAGSDTPKLLFESSSPLNLVIELDMKAIMTNKSENPAYASAVVIENKGGNHIQTYQIKVRPAGRTRRMESICDFPPLRLNFAKKSVVNTTFAGQDKLKLVTFCRTDESFQQYIKLEYLAYKFYNVITYNSLLVRMVNVTYKDINKAYPTIERIGFIIEEIEQLAERVEGTVSDKKIWSADSCDLETVKILTLFQFMIGNTDWWIHTRHNVKLLELRDGSLIPIPFDFDYAGIVETPYAIPSKLLPIANVRQRFIKDYCHDVSYFAGAISLFNQKKNQIYTMIQNADYLSNKNKRSTIKYVDEFYQIINSEAALERYLSQACDYMMNPKAAGH